MIFRWPSLGIPVRSKVGVAGSRFRVNTLSNGLDALCRTMGYCPNDVASQGICTSNSDVLAASRGKERPARFTVRSAGGPDVLSGANEIGRASCRERG